MPDFVTQTQIVQKIIEAQGDFVAPQWNDSVKERFFSDHLDKCKESVNTYLNGGMYMRGMGLVNLMDYLSENMAKLDRLLGSTGGAEHSADEGFDCGVKWE